MLMGGWQLVASGNRPQNQRTGASYEIGSPPEDAKTNNKYGSTLGLFPIVNVCKEIKPLTIY